MTGYCYYCGLGLILCRKTACRRQGKKKKKESDKGFGLRGRKDGVTINGQGRLGGAGLQEMDRSLVRGILIH